MSLILAASSLQTTLLYVVCKFEANEINPNPSLLQLGTINITMNRVI